MPDIKRSVRNPGAGANHKMVLSMISFMLLVSCPAPVTTDVWVSQNLLFRADLQLILEIDPDIQIGFKEEIFTPFALFFLKILRTFAVNWPIIAVNLRLEIHSVFKQA